MLSEETKKQFSWLNNDAYDAITANFTLENWLSEFQYRSDWWISWRIPDQFASDEERERILSRRIEFLTSYCERMKLKEEGVNAQLYEYDYSPVQSLTADSLATHAGDLFFSAEVAALEIDAYDFLAGAGSRSKLDALTNRPVHLIGIDRFEDVAEAIGSEVLARINLLASDELIIKGLRQWLKQVRAELAFQDIGEESFGDGDIKRWRDLRVLQYIDITLFDKLVNKTKKTQLKQHQSGEILFPHADFSPGERIRKTVKPEAERMLNSHVLACLEGQISYA
ncbi:DUF6387 family protein [Deefgea salmonis]|uniref:DUF6387 family protein n=1 Tax=Deefgea salmonis TaxID=2875502 RepID=A0ABS8BIU6_9NEIS|nr:DUF6387 family protein [Deefgea salmonis]MCB5195511.1 DUF6387 family protein [Deefgea salmonis]